MGLLGVILLFVLYVAQMECGDYIPQQTCGILYSEENFRGEHFALTDFDQSIDLTREYRHSIKGWNVTGSVKVSSGCKMTVCSISHLRGSCHEFTTYEAKISRLIWIAESANCTCERECSCENIAFAEDKRENGKLGRAYLTGGCDTCDAEYIQLWKQGHNFPTAERKSVKALAFDIGCTIDIFSGLNYTGDQLADDIEGPVYREHIGKFGSYESTCHPQEANDPPPESSTYFALRDLPIKIDEFEEKVKSDDTLTYHPGIEMARQSLQKKRSHRYVYVVLIGTNAPHLIGFPHFKESDPQQIGESRIQVRVDHLRITSGLRLITVPAEMYTNEEDLVATLDTYLSKRKDLNGIIPNAVIVHHHINDQDIEKEGSLFQLKLDTLQALRHRLIDSAYPNVIFQLSSLYTLEKKPQRYPVGRILEFDKVIRDKLPFLYPVTVSVSSDAIKGELHSVNGYVKMENKEYWPRNLEISLLNICEKAEDPLGRFILKEYFQNNWTPHWSIDPIYQSDATIDSFEVNTEKPEDF